MPLKAVLAQSKRVPAYLLPDPLTLAIAPPGMHCGTSGWAYSSWKPGFYPPGLSAKNFLSFYATRLNSVEVNYTFRTLPSPAMLEGWLAATPPGFRFSFKAPQRITHFSRLREVEEHVQAFVAAVRPAMEAGKLGVLLFQLPPNFSLHLERLQSLLTLPSLRSGLKIAFEFRHPSWFCDEAYALLREHGAALCMADGDDLATPEVHTATGHTCFRLRRDGGYTTREITAFASRMTALASAGREVYTYFRHQEEPTGALNGVAFLAKANKASRTR